MPRVVADSDDESEVIVISPPKAASRAAKTFNNPPPSSWDRDPLQNTDFEQFLSPTQRLSASDSTEDRQDDFDCSPIAVLTNSSHEHSLDRRPPPDYTFNGNRIAPAAQVPNMGGKLDKKRPRTALEKDGLKESSDKTRKRTKIGKTPIAPDTTRFATNFHDLAQNAGSFETMAASGGTYADNIDPSKTITPQDNDTSPLDVSLSLPTPLQQNHSFYGNSVSHGTTTHSSIGGYQSFNIDSQTLGSGIDSYNPFGTLSQVSLENGANEEDTPGIEQIFKKNTSRHVDRPDSSTGQPMELEHIPEMLTSFEKSSVQQPANTSPEYSPISTRAELVDDTEPISTEEHATTVKAPPKKRGRKLKATSDNMATVSIDRHGELQAENHLSRSMRAGSVTSISNVSDVSQPISNNKRSKKSKEAEDLPTTEQTKKMPSSELGLDKKAVIGLSPERYKPRPSKRRGRTGSLTSTTLDGSETQPLDVINVLVDEPAEKSLQDDVVAQPTLRKGRKSKTKKDTKSATSKSIELEQEAQGDPLSFEETNGQAQEDAEALLKSPKVSVNIPTLVKAEDHDDSASFALEPRKRGRKRKMAADDEVIGIGAQNRSVLEAKDVNVPTKSSIEDGGKAQLGDQGANDDGGSAIGQDDQENKSDSASIKENKSSTATGVKASTTPEPLARASTPLSWNSRARIGLSKRNRIPSLLQKINRNKEAPKVIERKEKLTKRLLEEKEQERIAREEAEAEGREYVPLDTMRDKDGRLIEWDF